VRAERLASCVRRGGLGGFPPQYDENDFSITLIKTTTPTTVHTRFSSPTAHNVPLPPPPLQVVENSFPAQEIAGVSPQSLPEAEDASEILSLPTETSDLGAPAAAAPYMNISDMQGEGATPDSSMDDDDMQDDGSPSAPSKEGHCMQQVDPPAEGVCTSRPSTVCTFPNLSALTPPTQVTDTPPPPHPHPHPCRT
jgi:hypothetical protein